MIGINSIGIYIPQKKEANIDKLEKFSIDENFLSKKIGVISRAIKEKHQKASDLCLEAFKNLKENLDINRIGLCTVVTQNPDYRLPHTSAIVHGKLGLPQNCACFDISLGCSGYVYGLAVAVSFMEKFGIKKGLLFTSDPYSEIIDGDDKNTSLLFGDAATVTLLTENPKWFIRDAIFETEGKQYEALIVKNGKLFMNGRAVFNYVLTSVPKQIWNLLEKNNLSPDDIDLFILHPGSKYMLDMLRLRLKLSPEKVPIDFAEYGNTVSSSIPIVLEKFLNEKRIKRILISGFGVGLSSASAILERAF
jgi:3-oxoacyl-[acyl-carrier-protein] synthase-3